MNMIQNWCFTTAPASHTTKCLSIHNKGITINLRIQIRDVIDIIKERDHLSFQDAAGVFSHSKTYQALQSGSVFGFFYFIKEAEILNLSRNFRPLIYVPEVIRTPDLPLRRSPDHCQSESCPVPSRHAIKAFSLLFKSFLVNCCQPL